MFPSGSSYRDQLEAGSFLYDCEQNPISKLVHEHSSLPFSNFPASFLDEDGRFLLSDWLSQHRQQVVLESFSLAETDGSEVASRKATNINKDKSARDFAAKDEEQFKKMPLKEVSKNKTNKNNTKKSATRKRSGKKDRHSKIYTAQGPRDRRMRLSLQIARKFFDLQDTLGFDKASKTIEWLLTKSRSAIQELAKNLQQAKPGCSNGAKSVSSRSENEVVSGVKRREDVSTDMKYTNIGESSIPRRKKKGKLRKAAPNPVAKESREKARERARERTKEKMKIRGHEEAKQNYDANPSNLEQIASSDNPRIAENVNSKKQEVNSSIKEVAEPEERVDSVSNTIENLLGFTSQSSTFSSTYHFLHSSASSGTISKGALPSFPANWEVEKDEARNNHNGMMTNMIDGEARNAHRDMSHMMKPLISNALAQYPIIPLATSHNVSSSQCYHSSSLFMTKTVSPRQNPRSSYMNSSDTDHDNLIPNSIPMSIPICEEQFPSPMFVSGSNVQFQSPIQENQLFGNPIFANITNSLF